jgi:hypothetical protein
VSRRGIAGALALSVLAVATTAEAGAPRKIAIANAPKVYVGTFTFPPGGGFLETDNLNPGGDTVMHAWDASTGIFLRGNDDYGGSTRSHIDFPPTPASTTVRVVVRSYHSDSPGTCTLRWGRAGFATLQGNIHYDGHLVYLATNYAMGTLFQTAEATLGSPDTVLVTMSGNGGAALNFDDDSGVGKMSQIGLSSDCISCVALVGTAYSSTPGPTTLYIDDDAGVRDADGDGVGDGLEGLLGTSPSKVDSDGDGLADNIEIYGVESSPVMKLPAWGADPTKPDVFVEADWLQACDPTQAGCGLPGGTDPDGLRLPDYWAEQNAASYAPDIRVHIDTGVANTNPATATIHGAWGGATRIAGYVSYCDGRADGFRRVFHHVIMGGTGGGGQTTWDGCSRVGFLTLRHELGHQLGLGHGGGDTWNCKPHYPSPMNYAFTFDFSTQFSRGRFASLVLNPYQGVDESLGLGTTDPNLFGYLQHSTMGFATSSTGAVDWNRDGIYGSGPTQASVIWPYGFSDCDVGVRGGTSLGTGDKPTFAWLEDAAGNGSLYAVFNTWPGQFVQRTAAQTDVDRCQAGPEPAGDCVAFTPAAVIPSAAEPFFTASALTSFDSRHSLMLVYAGGDSLYYQTRTAAWDWSSPLPVGSGQWNGGTEPAAIEYPPGTVNVFSAGIGGVKRNRYSSYWGNWDGAGTMVTWSDGTVIAAGNVSPALAVGYMPDRDGPQLVALFTGPDQMMTFARYEPATDTWTAFPASIWADYHGTWGTPGLAWAPIDRNDPTSGRFYLMFNPANGSPVALTMTEGADPRASATTRRLWFRPNVMAFNEWLFMWNGESVALGFDPAHDTNVRAAITGKDGNSAFFPIADGRPNVGLRDYDDYALMLGNLAGSLVTTWP